MGIGSFLFGKKNKIKKVQTATPEAMQAMQQIWQALQLGQGPYADIYGPYNPQNTADYFQKGVAEPANRNFQQNTIPNIMQAFADQGASSGLGSQLASAGRNLQSDLDAQLAQTQYQAMLQNQQNRAQGLTQGLNYNPYQFYQQQGSGGLVPSILGSFAQGAGQSFNPWAWWNQPQGNQQGYGAPGNMYPGYGAPGNMYPGYGAGYPNNMYPKYGGY